MISSLYSPIADCCPLSNPDAAPYDKRWLVIDAEGKWVRAHDCSRLSTIKVDISLGFLVMRAPGMLRLDIPLDIIEDDDSVRRQARVGLQHIDVVDEGELAAVWISKCLDKACRLVKVHPDAAPVLWPEA